MITSTLIGILKTFTGSEIRSFDDMVSSPYFNRKSAVIKFWKVVSNYAPEFSSPQLKREKVYDKIFPGKKFNYGTMKNLIHDLTKLTEKFMELTIYDLKAANQSANLLESFLKRGLNGNFEKKIKVFENLIEENKSETDYYSSKYLLEILKQNYLILQDKHSQIESSIRSANENLTMGYLVDVLGNNYNSLFMQEEPSRNAGNDFIQKVLEFYRAAPVEMDYRVKIYFNAFMLVIDGGMEYFHSQRKLLEENAGKLSSEQKYNFFVSLANFCTKKFDNGFDEFAQKKYEIYRFMIDNSFYSINILSNIDGPFFINVASAAINAGESKWALQFIEKFKDKLEPDVKENYYFHALIEYNLKLRNFEQTLKYLPKIKHINYEDKLSIKHWEIITSYELGHYEKLRNQIDSARHFLQSDKKISPAKKERLFDFINVVIKLLSLKESAQTGESSRIDTEMLRKEIEKIESSHKFWLLEKFEELM